MKERLWLIYKQVIPPMVAMMILTLLVGMTVHQMSVTWEQELNNMARKLTHALVINNIRHTLWQAKEKQETDPDEADQLLQTIRSQLNALKSLDPEYAAEYSTDTIEAFLKDEQHLAHLEAMLSDPLLDPASQKNLLSLQENVRQLQQYTGTVTHGVTLSMLCLGLILMAITALDLSRLFRDLDRSRDLNIHIQESERRRIAQDLHDGVIQGLIDMKRSYAPEKVDSLVENIRRICHNLKPQVMEDIGFAAAIEFLADDLRDGSQRRVHVFLDEGQLQALPKAYELTLFRVIQELFNNIKRHSPANLVTLTFVYDPSESRYLRISLKYDDPQFDIRLLRKGMGLTGVEERIHHLGGRVKYTMDTQQGVRFQLLVPVPKG